MLNTFYCNNPKSNHYFHVLHYGHHICEEFGKKTVNERNQICLDKGKGVGK